MSLIYCYGFIEDNLVLNEKGFEDKNVYLIPFKDISAVVSDVSEENFSQEVIDKNIKNIRWLAEKGQIHERVVDKVMQKTTIMPMKFCTIFKTKENVENMLEEKYGDFKFNLRNLKDKIEMGVKVYFDTTQLKEKIKQESEEIKNLEKEAKKKTPGAAYFEKKKIDILLKEEVRRKLLRSTKDVLDKIKVFAEKFKQNELINKKITNKDMLLNAVFLINKFDVSKFKEKVDKIKLEYRDFKFEMWGPFPPYNFIK